MILYVTKKTKERLNIPMVNELSDISKKYASIVLNSEENTELLKWGIKMPASCQFCFKTNNIFI